MWFNSDNLFACCWSVPHNSAYIIYAESQCKYNSFGIWLKKIKPHSAMLLSKMWLHIHPLPPPPPPPPPQKKKKKKKRSIIAIESKCLSITGRNFLFHHCTLAINVVPDTEKCILRAQIVTSHLVHSLDIMTRGSGTILFNHKAFYGRGDRHIKLYVYISFKQYRPWYYF